MLREQVSTIVRVRVVADASATTPTIRKGVTVSEISTGELQVQENLVLPLTFRCHPLSLLRGTPCRPVSYRGKSAGIQTTGVDHDPIGEWLCSEMPAVSRTKEKLLLRFNVYGHASRA